MLSQAQLDAAAELAQEVEALKSENLEAWRTKYTLESEMAAVRAQLDGMQRQSGSMHQVRLTCSLFLVGNRSALTYVYCARMLRGRGITCTVGNETERKVIMAAYSVVSYV